MKKITIIKMIFVIIIGLGVMFIGTNAFAANDTGFTDLSNTLNNTGSNNTANTDNTANTANKSNTSLNTSTSNTSSTTNKTNSSSYNSTNLPKTGIEDSLPIAILVVVLGISAVYAYKKVKDYQNL